MKIPTVHLQLFVTRRASKSDVMGKQDGQYIDGHFCGCHNISCTWSLKFTHFLKKLCIAISNQAVMFRN